MPFFAADIYYKQNDKKLYQEKYNLTDELPACHFQVTPLKAA